ncbi:ankyrin repeat domain-containing protein 34B [Cololabis saira]|uniref:ankyrin repeat domain-containing protein 34B n=1 Tax=Cololabis saira TaxID=129043 RepID=UPI002AD227D2|nr:ankyrin repeat domain-containing protein 34B [Cololabis saira]
MEGEACNLGVSMDSGNPLLRAVFLRRLRLTRLLLEGGAYINESNSQGQTPLMVACRTKHVDSQSASLVKLIQFLLEKGADPNIQDKDGRSVLMHACREQAGPEVVSLLLASGADLSLEDQCGTSALAYAVMAGDWKVLKLLLDTCKAKGKEVIIITTDQFPAAKLQAMQYLNMPPMDHSDKITPPSPASPSDIQLITSPQNTSSSLCPPRSVFSFKEGQICGVSSHPCSPSRLRGLGQSTHNGQQQPLLRLNSEPWLKIPPSLQSQQPHATLKQTEDVSLKGPKLDGVSNTNFDGFRIWESRLAGDEVTRGDRNADHHKDAPRNTPLAGMLLSHSASHPNLHSDVLGPDSVTSSSCTSGTKNLGTQFHSMASSSLQSVIQRRELREGIYSSDPQLARGIPNIPEEHRTRDPINAKRLAPLRCASTLGLKESLLAKNKRILHGYECRASGTLLLDRNLQARPRSLPPLTNTPILNVYSQSSGSGSSFSERESGQKHFLPCAPPGQPKEVTRRMLLRRHSIQAEQFKTTA